MEKENVFIRTKHRLGSIYGKTMKEFSWIKFNLFWYKPTVLSEEETIKKILAENLSVSRFGDVEYKLMTERGYIGFQDSNKKLSSALVKAFNVRQNNILICSYNYAKKFPTGNAAYDWFKCFAFMHYSSVKSLFDREYIYGNTDITRFYYPALFEHTDFEYLSKQYIPLLKRLWEDRNLLIVEGEQTKLGMGNDLFDNSRSIRRILCPARNAFDKIDSIENSVKNNYNDGDLVLLALGPTASVLAVRLTEKYGMQCIDIGHVDVVYIWFLNRCKSTCGIEGKYVNEARKDTSTLPYKYDTEIYSAQIIDAIA